MSSNEPAHEQSPDDGVDQPSVHRRQFLTRGGLLAGGAALGAAAVGMAPAGAQTATFDNSYLPVHPITRVYDSRLASGPLFNGGTRILLTGLDSAPTPPYAITLNLTVTLTRQKGWLAVYPGDETFGGTSSINWFGDFQDLANNVFVRIPADGSIKVTCGGIPGAQADFVMDWIGAGVAIDTSAASTSSVHPPAQPWREG